MNQRPAYDPLQTMRAWSPAQRWRHTLIAMLVALPLCIWAASLVGDFFTVLDTFHYLQLAQGRPVMLPFASRQLAPMLVGALMSVSHLGLHAAFVVEGMLALLFSFYAVVTLAIRSGAPRWMLPAVAGAFFWVMQFNGLALPDLMYTALLCGLLLLLDRGLLLAAALMMFPLMLTRESTLLTLVCLLLAGWGVLRAREMLAAVAAAVAGIVAVKALTTDVLPNSEHISPVLYLLAKMPWNALRNFTGLFPFADIVPSCTVPQWQTAVHLGPLHRVGLCGWSFPWLTALELLTCFGLLPLLAWRLRDTRLPGPRREHMMLRFAVVYGTISFLIAGALGATLTRLFSYSWPLFLVAVPAWVGAARANFTSGRAALLFVTLHLLLTWLNFRAAPSLVWVAAVLFGLGMWLAARTFTLGAAGQG